MTYETWLRSDVMQPLKIVQLPGVFFSGDDSANLIGVEVYSNGAAFNLSGGCTGYVIRPDGKTLHIIGSVSGNKASIVLPASAYAVEGYADITIKMVEGSVKTTVAACRGYVHRTTTDEIIDPGHTIPDIDELLAQLSALESATEAAGQATTNANTAATNANAKAVLAETAATNADSKATLANTAANTANTAATNADNKATLANTAAQTANTAASNADSKATLANTAANTANTAATNADSKATLANTAAQTANTAATNADAKADLANTAAQTANTAATNADAKAALADSAAQSAMEAAENAPTDVTSTITYQTSTSGSTIPTGTWQSAIPNVPQGSWLWIKTVLTWNNGDTSDPMYAKAYNGVDGGGVIYIEDTIDENGGTVRTITASQG